MCDHAMREPVRRRRSELEPSDPDGIVVRTCQVFGADPRRANFVLRITDQVRAGREVRAAVDLFGTPTRVDDLAETMLSFTLGSDRGPMHVAGPEYLSRFDLAQRVATAAGADINLVIGVRKMRSLMEYRDRPGRD
jgi:dTDP-4-dehydrorhamnose reductase